MRKIFFISLALVCAFVAKAKEPTILIPGGSKLVEVAPAEKDFSKGGLRIREYAQDCPVAVFANVATTVKLDTVHVFELPIKHYMSDIRWFCGAFFYADGSKIGRCWNNGTDLTLLDAGAPVTTILPAMDGILYSTEKSLVFCDYANKDGHILHESKGNIILANYYAGYIFFADGKDVYIISGNEKVKIYSDKRQIKAMAVHPDGAIFLCTDKGTFMLNNDYQRLQLSKESAAAIEVIGDDLFLTFTDGRCVMVENCSEYKKQLPKK